MELTSEQIQILLIEKIAGTIDPQDDKAIELLLAEDVAVRQQWQNLNQEIQQSEAQGFSVDINEEEHWQEMKPFLRTPNRARLVAFSRIVSSAAVIAAVVAGVYFFSREQVPVPAKRNKQGITLSMDNGRIIQLQNRGPKTLEFGGASMRIGEKGLTCISSSTGLQQWSTLAVPAALDYKVRLADGTEVWLNAETKLRFPAAFPGPTREVYVEGEAYFKVAKNRLRPFVVHTPQTAVMVTGTQFNVNTYNPDNIQTALVEGSVTTKGAGNRQVEIKPGFRVIYNARKGFHTEAFDETDVLSWMKGVYYFHDTPLQELAKVLSRWYNTKVLFENAALQNKTFSGELTKTQPLQLFLENLRLSADVNSDLKDGMVYFK